MKTKKHFETLTSLRVDAEETLGVPASDLIGQLFTRLGVWVKRLNVDDGDIFG